MKMNQGNETLYKKRGTETKMKRNIFMEHEMGSRYKVNLIVVVQHRVAQ